MQFLLMVIYMQAPHIGQVRHPLLFASRLRHCNHLSLSKTKHPKKRKKKKQEKKHSKQKHSKNHKKNEEKKLRYHLPLQPPVSVNKGGGLDEGSESYLLLIIASSSFLSCMKVVRG